MATINQTSSATEKRKASAFINVTVVLKDGTKKQLGGIPLYGETALHSAMLKHLANGGEVQLETGVHVVSSEEDYDNAF